MQQCRWKTERIGQEEAEKRPRKRQREEVTWWKNVGTGLHSGTARFLMGSFPSAPWEVRSSALQSHQGHHLLQLEGQSLFPGSIILLQRTHDLPQWGKHTHSTSALKAANGKRLLYATVELIGHIFCCDCSVYRTRQDSSIQIGSFISMSFAGECCWSLLLIDVPIMW